VTFLEPIFGVSLAASGRPILAAAKFSLKVAYLVAVTLRLSSIVPAPSRYTESACHNCRDDERRWRRPTQELAGHPLVSLFRLQQFEVLSSDCLIRDCFPSLLGFICGHTPYRLFPLLVMQ